jgi:hypothetical protein
MPSSEKLRRVTLVRTDVSEERGAPLNRVIRNSELGTNNRRTEYFFAACVGS